MWAVGLCCRVRVLQSSHVVCLLSLGGVPSQSWVGSHLAPFLGEGGEEGLVVAQTWSPEATNILRLRVGLSVWGSGLWATCGWGMLGWKEPRCLGRCRRPPSWLCWGHDPQCSSLGPGYFTGLYVVWTSLSL